MNPLEIYFDFLFNTIEVTTSSYYKFLQFIYETIKQVDKTALIIKYKDEEEEIMEANNTSIKVKAKYTLLNYVDAIPQFL